MCRHTRLCLLATPWPVARQAPLSLRFSGQEHWSGWPFPPPGDLPHPGTELTSLMSPALGGRFFTTSTTWEAPYTYIQHLTASTWWGPGFKSSSDSEIGTLHPYSQQSTVMSGRLGKKTKAAGALQPGLSCLWATELGAKSSSLFS